MSRGFSGSGLERISEETDIMRPEFSVSGVRPVSEETDIMSCEVSDYEVGPVSEESDIMSREVSVSGRGPILKKSEVMINSFSVSGVGAVSEDWTELFPGQWVQFETKNHQKHCIFLMHVGWDDPKRLWESIQQKLINTFGNQSVYGSDSSGYLFVIVNTCKIVDEHAREDRRVCKKLLYWEKRLVIGALYAFENKWRPLYSV